MRYEAGEIEVGYITPTGGFTTTHQAAQYDRRNHCVNDAVRIRRTGEICTRYRWLDNEPAVEIVEEDESRVECCAQCIHRSFPAGLAEEGRCDLDSREIHASDNPCEGVRRDPLA